MLKYHEIFRQRKEAGAHDLRVAAIYSYGTNEEYEETVGALPDDSNLACEPPATYRSWHSRDALEHIIKDYNAQYSRGYSTKDEKGLQDYFKDITKKLREREKRPSTGSGSTDEKDRIDLVLVVNMMLTGFDAKKVNTLHVDKNLRHHGLIQAYSRTNRILDERKSQGNIMVYRNLKERTDEAIALFSNLDAKETIFLPAYDGLVAKFQAAVGTLRAIAPTHEWVHALPNEEEELAFIRAFRAVLRQHNVLKTHVEFTWAEMPLTEQEFNNYKSAYLDLHDKVKRNSTREKASILEDIDFDLELLHRDLIDRTYILMLLARLKNADAKDRTAEKKKLMDLLSGDVELRSKRELIERFVNENLPLIEDADNIPDEFERYWQEQKVLALEALCVEEHLDRDQFSKLIDAYVFTNQEPLKEDVFKCLGERPSVLKAREIGERVIARMKEWVEVFVRGMAA